MTAEFEDALSPWSGNELGVESDSCHTIEQIPLSISRIIILLCVISLVFFQTDFFEMKMSAQSRNTYS